MDPVTSIWNTILSTRTLTMHFMPIVRFNRVRRLVHWAPMGYEALVRGPDNSILRRPDALFTLANSLGLKRELELWCVSQALSLLPQLARNAALFINIGVDTLQSSEFAALLAERTPHLDPRRVVFEILEGSIPCVLLLRKCITRYSRLGYRFAIDDIGGRGSSLGRMVQIGPVSFLKIDRTFLPRVWQEDPHRARCWLEGIRETARVTGAQIVIEGIEEQYSQMLPELHRLGINLGQGYLFGQAAPLEAPAGEPRPSAPRSTCLSLRAQGAAPGAS